MLTVTNLPNSLRIPLISSSTQSLILLIVTFLKQTPERMFPCQLQSWSF